MISMTILNHHICLQLKLPVTTQPTLETIMSTKQVIEQALISTGHESRCINRAFKVYEKNYGNIYNVEVFIEFIKIMRSRYQCMIQISNIIPEFSIMYALIFCIKYDLFTITKHKRKCCRHNLNNVQSKVTYLINQPLYNAFTWSICSKIDRITSVLSV